MRVLFVVRPDLFTVKAGDTVQVLILKKALEKLGLRVDLNINKVSLDDLHNYDLIHLFNLLRVEVCERFLSNINVNKPVLLTPIYWNMEEYLKHSKPDLLYWWKLTQKRRMEVLTKVDMVAPNAHTEWDRIKYDFRIEKPCEIIYNGVVPWKENIENSQREYILCVGRIHPRKNQLQLIKALKEFNLPLVLIGDINDPAYFRECLRESEGYNVTIYGAKSREELFQFYLKSKIHVLPSWYETPGLVNLEAALAGCNIVTTDRGTTREYFKNKVSYCSPLDIKDIADKVVTAYYTEPDPELSQYVKTKYNHNSVAYKTMEVYKKLI
ncbi:glycosyltransferase family 4 protein [Halothermothrix orenii]|uniref:Glycosyl transferase group 1 n=1 Tax=Halothermothrix orenii (strain H 168 / OCM 544 / DSM 9562) TaxID=373903 RepID=B8D0H6_HALOH|nr:glycosyltransferase family 4 protein [Halothermothrix orenii]ACL70912.1 glycosyl transferase group 1 [Halothermothrix orenii H 168]